MGLRRVFVAQVPIYASLAPVDWVVLYVHPRRRVRVDADDLRAQLAEDEGPIAVLHDGEEVDVFEH